MYKKTTYGYILRSIKSKPTLKGRLDVFVPVTHKSENWKYWRAILDTNLCPNCSAQHGKVYAKDEQPEVLPPLHKNCRCAIIPTEAIIPGQATNDGRNGADYWVARFGELPGYYISKADIEALDWKPGKSPRKYAPDKMIFGGVYENENGHLPQVPGRIWYEADINYYEGKRNMHRILFSNDGLIFVTYDHYKTFYEINTEVLE